MSEIPAKRARTTSVQECRACLTKLDDESCFVDVFRAWDPAWSGMGLSIAEDLAKLTNIEISVSDALTKIICKECCARLQDAIQFTTNVQSNDIVLRERHKNSIDENPLWPKPIQVDKNITGNALSEMDIEVKQEVLTEDEYEINEVTNEQYGELGEPRLDIKIEPEEIQPASSHVIDVNGAYSLQTDQLESLQNGEAETLEENSSEEVKEEPTSEDEPSSDMPKDCMLCLKTFHTVKGLKAHVIAVHSYATVTSSRANVCMTCNKSFATRTDLFVHETCHSMFACYVCDRKFATFHLLMRHRSKNCTSADVMPRLKTLDDVRRPFYIIPDKKSASSENETKKIKHDSSSHMENTGNTNLASVNTEQVEKLKHDGMKEDKQKNSDEQDSIMNDVELLLEEIHRETKISEKPNIETINSNSKEVTVHNEKTPQSNKDHVTMTYVLEEKINSTVANGSEIDDSKDKEIIGENVPIDANSCQGIKQEQDTDLLVKETAQSNYINDQTENDDTKPILSEDNNEIKKDLSVSPESEKNILKDDPDALKVNNTKDIVGATKSMKIEETFTKLEPLENLVTILNEDIEKQLKTDVDEAMDIDLNGAGNILESDKLI